MQYIHTPANRICTYIYIERDVISLNLQLDLWWVYHEGSSDVQFPTPPFWGGVLASHGFGSQVVFARIPSVQLKGLCDVYPGLQFGVHFNLGSNPWITTWWNMVFFCRREHDDHVNPKAWVNEMIETPKNILRNNDNDFWLMQPCRKSEFCRLGSNGEATFFVFQESWHVHPYRNRFRQKTYSQTCVFSIS